MSTHRTVLVLAAMYSLALLAPVHGGDLPSDAAKRVKEFDAEVDAIKKKADSDISARRARLIEDLQKLAKEYARTGEADAARHIRERIVRLKESVERGRNLIVNGSFEEGPELNEPFMQLEKESTVIRGWTVSQGNIDLVHESLWAAADGKRSLDMNGIVAGGISQTFKTRKDQKYRVTFAMAGNTNSPLTEKKLQVRAAGKMMDFTFDATGKTATDMGWHRQTWEFTATADETTLEFVSQMDGAGGPALDDVMVLPIGE